MQRYPEGLADIYKSVQALQCLPSTIRTLAPAWEAHIAMLRERIPEIHIEGQGEVVYLGSLSPGCQTCKAGTWDCIFLTMKCNLSCPFCLSPHKLPRDYTVSAFGHTQAEILGNHHQTTIQGISFSGGEVFCVPERLFDWLGAFKADFPDRYYWLYTNGVLARKEHLRELERLGLDEIRFNAAATGYDDPTVLENIARAAEHIPTVTVEIPAIPADVEKLLAVLGKWVRLGVKYLNLHTLMYGPGTNAATMPGERRSVRASAGELVTFNPHSRMLTLSVMQEVLEKGYSLSVNDCSIQSKIRQIRGVRKALTLLLLREHEKLVDGTLYETCCVFQDEGECDFFHPDLLPEMRKQYPDGYRFVALARTAPVSVHDPGRWVRFLEL